MKCVSDADLPLYTKLSAFVRNRDPWRLRVSRCMPDVTFYPGATDIQLDDLRQSLGHDLPEDLVGLLRETNSIVTPYSTLVYSTEQIGAVNLDFRTNPLFGDRMPFDHLLIFGEIGDGDQFAYPVNRDGSLGMSVFVWSHETDCREEYAMFLADYVAKYTVELYTPYISHRNERQ